MQKSLFVLLAMLCNFPCSATELPTEDVTFVSHGATLSGSIVFPASGEIRAAVVFIHGSGKQARNLDLGARFAREGIAALVYDKRGVGKSGGEYEANQSVGERNLLLLADDAAAALAELARHSRLKGVPLGFAGISQAGWIAPLAARKTDLAGFLVMWSGPVCKVSEEDIFSKFTSDADAEHVAPRYEEALKARTQKYIWPDFLGRDTDSGEDLAKLSIPGLWLFSDNDESIPVDISVARLQALRADRHRFDYVVFSGLGHNNMEGTFPAATDWMRRLGFQRR
ncbi:MAG TPA: alpha/beta fold hydrolase [Steroidobacteraceae bacterium]|nr:alpha/beta fold hydrolase [Steroidobacteraceae bacterium]